jgi:hypothetical protein
MQSHCPFPIQFSDNRRCYRTTNAPGFTLAVLLIAVLAGYAGFSEARTLNPGVVGEARSGGHPAALKAG